MTGELLLESHFKTFTDIFWWHNTVYIPLPYATVPPTVLVSYTHNNGS